MSSKGRIVVIDDEVNAAKALETLLKEDGYEVGCAHDARAGLALVEQIDADIVLTDLRMPGMDGLELLARLKQSRPHTLVILMTAYGTVKNAVRAMKNGAEDYLSKPLDLEELEVVVERTIEKKRLIEETRQLRERVADKYRFENMLGESPGMLHAFKAIRQVAPSSASVLLLGESGTGKELFAQALHEASPRRGRPFIKVACAALTETLLESELFGHEKGAFTGAISSRAGRFEAADGGTLFLDEIGDISLTVQVKLLRFMEEREFERVGGNRTYKVDVRIVCATHRDLSKMIADGAFREDLYYRLNVIEIRIPALRERIADVPLLAQHFLTKYAAQNGKGVRSCSDEAMALLVRQAWPGNVRQLENVIERAVVLAEEPVLTPIHFPTLRGEIESAASKSTAVAIPGSSLAAIEREAILRTIESVAGSTSRAAKILGISPRKIQYKLKEYQTRAQTPLLRPKASGPPRGATSGKAASRGPRSR